MKTVKPCLVMICVMLCGCTSSLHVANDGIEYSRAAEDAANRELLLNVVRAKERRPLRFTAFTKFAGSRRLTVGSGELGLNFGDDAGNATLAPSVSIETGPNYDVTVLGSREFYNGIVTPVSADLLNYFIAQGFPRVLVAYLFIRRVNVCEEGTNFSSQEFEEDEEKSCYLNPDHCYLNIAFRMANKKFDNCTIGLMPYLKKTRFRFHNSVGDPVVTGINLANVGQAEPLLKQDFTIEADPENQGEFNLFAPKVPMIQGIGLEDALLTIRSPESLIYFLGEMARNPTYTPKIPYLESRSNRKAPLFRMHRGEQCTSSQPAISVDYEGETYCIDRNDHTSLMVMRITDLVLRLRTTGEVRVLQ